MVSPWVPIDGTDHHYGALGAARFTALPRAAGGLYLLTSSGPKVTVSAQLYQLITLGPDGTPISSPIGASVPLGELALVPTTHGAAIVASMTGRSVAARWLDDDTAWRESFSLTPFRKQGDGPAIREKATAWVLATPGLPIDLGAPIAQLLGERCPFVMTAGERQLLLGCEEGAGPESLSARAWVRRIGF